MPYAKQSVAQRVGQILTELGVPQGRLVMPTRENLVAYEAVVEAATTLAEAKKHSDRLEAELRTQRERLNIREATDIQQEGEEGESATHVADIHSSSWQRLKPPNEYLEKMAKARATSVASSHSARSRRAVRSLHRMDLLFANNVR